MARCKFFFSGLSTFWKELEEYGISGFNELISYYEWRNHKEWGFDLFDTLLAKRSELMIDSGAFSAWNSKKFISMDEFIAFHNELRTRYPNILLKAGLDDIGSHEMTKENFLKTQAAGLDLFPTFHLQDPPELLDWILDHKPHTMAFGGLVSSALHDSGGIEDWLDTQYEKISGPDGIARIKTHLFGVSNVTMLQRVPATSCDSASALFTGAYGVIWVPRLDPITLRPDYNRTMERICISKESPAQAKANQHYHNMKPGQREVIEEFVRAEGFDVQKMVDRHQERKVFCVKMQLNQANAFPDNLRYVPRTTEHDFFS